MSNEDKFREALSLALQFVPASSESPEEQKEIDQIHKLIKEATADKPDDWFAPTAAERHWQEERLKKLFPGYPSSHPKHQYLNGLIRFALDNGALDNGAIVKTKKKDKIKFKAA